MSDIVAILASIVLFAVAILYVHGCEQLKEGPGND
jgi:hypothetical protein